MSGSRWAVWRTNRGGRVEAERVLAGATATNRDLQRAAEAELASARGFGHNDFKIELAKRTMVERPERPDRPARYVMSLIRKVVETVARYMPDARRTPDAHRVRRSYRTDRYSRVDGPLKVTGRARFAAEFAARRPHSCRPRAQHDCEAGRPNDRHRRGRSGVGLHRA